MAEATNPITTASNPRVGEDVGRLACEELARIRAIIPASLSYEVPDAAEAIASTFREYVKVAAEATALRKQIAALAGLRDCSIHSVSDGKNGRHRIQIGCPDLSTTQDLREALDSIRKASVASTGSGKEETKGEPSGTGSREPGPSVPAYGFDPSRGWRPICDAPKGRDENGILQQVLLIGSYPTNGHHTDIVQSWWCPVGSADVDGYWERWRHAFPPSHWMPVPAPPSVRDRSSEAAETSGSAGGKSPADLSATPEATPKSSPSQTPVAWKYEYCIPNGEGVWEQRVSLDQPRDGHWIRALEPLFGKSSMHDRAETTEAALRTLQAAGEVQS